MEEERCFDFARFLGHTFSAVCDLERCPLGPPRGPPARGTLTYNIHVRVGEDGSVGVGRLTLVHGRVVRLQVGKADLPGGEDITSKWVFCKRSHNVSLIKNRT